MVFIASSTSMHTLYETKRISVMSNSKESDFETERCFEFLVIWAFHQMRFVITFKVLQSKKIGGDCISLYMQLMS